jgi:uncharacterized protein with HEPN domain
MEADQLGRLRDILQASRLIASYMKDTSEAQFRADTQKQDAVIRRIEIIGEATAHLSEETRREIAALPFRKMRGMRNIVAHDYANVDLSIVWQVATVQIPEVCFALETFFSKEEPIFVVCSLNRRHRGERAVRDHFRFASGFSQSSVQISGSAATAFSSASTPT